MPGISQASVQSAKGGVFISALSPGTVGHIAQVSREWVVVGCFAEGATGGVCAPQVARVVLWPQEGVCMACFLSQPAQELRCGLRVGWLACGGRQCRVRPLRQCACFSFWGVGNIGDSQAQASPRKVGDL